MGSEEEGGEGGRGELWSPEPPAAGGEGAALETLPRGHTDLYEAVVLPSSTPRSCQLARALYV